MWSIEKLNSLLQGVFSKRYHFKTYIYHQFQIDRYLRSSFGYRTTFFFLVLMLVFSY